MEKSASSDTEEPQPSTEYHETATPSTEYHETATETGIMADKSSCAVINTKYF